VRDVFTDPECCPFFQNVHAAKPSVSVGRHLIVAARCEQVALPTLQNERIGRMTVVVPSRRRSETIGNGYALGAVTTRASNPFRR
jgi:hypothetical protein